MQPLQAVCRARQQQHLRHALICLQLPRHKERPTGVNTTPNTASTAATASTVYRAI